MILLRLYHVFLLEYCSSHRLFGTCVAWKKNAPDGHRNASRSTRKVSIIFVQFRNEIWMLQQILTEVQDMKFYENVLKESIHSL
jgi:hypothetical protein